MKKQILPILGALLLLCAGSLTIHDLNKYEGNEAYEEGEEEEAESGADKALSSWFWSRAYPDPANLSEKYIRAWEQVKQIRKNTEAVFGQTALRGQNTTGFGSWSLFGPKVFGGRILSLAINPTLNTSGKRTIFAGSASGGIWKTYDDGTSSNSWMPVVTGHPVLGVSSIIYHPSDTNVLLAGTGEVYRVETYASGASTSNQVGNIGRNVWKARGTYGIGILRSTDGGTTWTQTMSSVPNLFGVQRIRFDPANASIVYACATNGLYKSTDGGASWSAEPIWSANWVSDVIIDPSNSSNLLVAVGNVGNAIKGIFRSTNGGTTFTQVLAGAFPSAAKANYRGSVRFEISGTTLFASIGMNDLDGSATTSTYSNENELYVSTNFGTSWTMITNSNHASFQSWYSHAIMPFPGSTTKLFMAGVNKYIINISGSTGTRTSIGTGSNTTNTYLLQGDQEGSNYLHDDVHDIQFVPGSSTVAYFATDGGIFRTANAGATSPTFVSCNGGLQVAQFYPTIAQSRTGTTIMGGLQDNNTVRYNGTGWAKIYGGDGGAAMFKSDDENVVLSSSDTRGFRRSTNNGVTSTQVLSYLGSISSPNDDRTAFVAPVATSAADPNRFYVGSDNLHVSTDGGASFTGNGVPGTSYIEALRKPAIAIGASDLNASKLYVSTSPFAQNITNDNLYFQPPANIRKSINGGSSFTTVTNGLPDRVVTDFAISRTFDDSVFITLSGFGTTHIYVSGDGGASWSPRGSGLPDVPFNTILFDPVNPKIMYAGCDYGVYVSPDRGQNWYDFNNGLWDATYVVDLATTTVGGVTRLRAATHGRGIIESSLFSLSILPVHVLAFSGQAQSSGNLLQWTVGAEQNVTRYEVERADRNGVFSRVGSLGARGSASYTLQDPWLAGGSTFYRLKIVDADGSYRYSEVVMVRREKGASGGMTVIGNPFRSSLQLEFRSPDAGPVEIRLYHINGQLLRRRQVVAGTGSTTVSLPGLSGLPAGLYVVEAQRGKARWTEKVVKE